MAVCSVRVKVRSLYAHGHRAFDDIALPDENTLTMLSHLQTSQTVLSTWIARCTSGLFRYCCTEEELAHGGVNFKTFWSNNFKSLCFLSPKYFSCGKKYYIIVLRYACPSCPWPTTVGDDVPWKFKGTQWLVENSFLCIKDLLKAYRRAYDEGLPQPCIVTLGGSDLWNISSMWPFQEEHNLDICYTCWDHCWRVSGLLEQPVR